MKRKLLLTVMCMLANYAQAATEFENTIPLDLAKVFLNFGNAADVGIYSDILENFPEIEIPAGFNILGSLDQGVMQRVVLQTNYAREEANILLLEALTAEGWQELQPPEMAVSQPRGFVPAGGQQPNAIPLMLCHDDLGNMTLMMADGVNGNIVSLIRNNNRMMGGRLTCAQQEQQRGQSFGMRGNMPRGVAEFMPTLQMPNPTGGPSTGIPRSGFITGGSGGSSNDFEMRSNLNIDWSINELYDFFAEQLSEQGWIQDSAWNGSITGGGNWTKNPEENLDLISILSIVEIAEDAFEMKLRILSRGN